MRRDLTADKFDGPFVPGLSGPQVGDQRLDLPRWSPPYRGYFEIRQVGEIVGGTSNVAFPVLYEPGGSTAPATTDGEGIWSSRATSHIMRFTVHLPDVSASELFCGEAPTYVATNATVNAFVTGQPVCYSRWAEVLYFVWANGDSTTANSSGQSLPLYSLRRRIRQLAPQGTFVASGLSQSAAAQEVVKYPGLALVPIQVAAMPGPNNWSIKMLGPGDVTVPSNRVGTAARFAHAEAQCGQRALRDRRRHPGHRCPLVRGQGGLVQQRDLQRDIRRQLAGAVLDRGQQRRRPVRQCSNLDVEQHASRLFDTWYKFADVNCGQRIDHEQWISLGRRCRTRSRLESTSVPCRFGSASTTARPNRRGR